MVVVVVGAASTMPWGSSGASTSGAAAGAGGGTSWDLDRWGTAGGDAQETEYSSAAIGHMWGTDSTIGWAETEVALENGRSWDMGAWWCRALEAHTSSSRALAMMQKGTALAVLLSSRAPTPLSSTRVLAAPLTSRAHSAVHG